VRAAARQPGSIDPLREYGQTTQNQRAEEVEIVGLKYQYPAGERMLAILDRELRLGGLRWFRRYLRSNRGQVRNGLGVRLPKRLERPEIGKYCQGTP
jgi:hypothetical protein